MDAIADEAMADDNRLPADVESQPLVRAAAGLQPLLRELHDEIEREQRFPRALVEKMREAGLYRMVIPRSLGGYQADALTYLRAVELMAEGCGSVGWNLANNGIVQLVSLGLPDEGVHEIYAQSPSTPGAGTAVQGGGQGVPVEGGYRVTGRWSFGSGSPEASWMLGSFQILDDGKPRLSPEGRPLYWRGFFSRAEVEIVPGSWDVTGLRGTGSFDWTVHDVFLPERRTMVHAGVPLDNQWDRWPGVTYSLPTQCWIGPHHSAVITGIARAGIDALIELAGGKTPRGRTGLLCDHPQVRVKPEGRERFLKAIEVDALGSERDERDCFRFNVLQDQQDRNVYYFYEVYRDEKALEAHRAAPHYAVWRAAADTLDGPPQATRCDTVFPAATDYWERKSARV